MTPRERSEAIKAEAYGRGFDACGVAAAGPSDPDGNLDAWLERGFHGSMDWMTRTRDTRVDVRAKLPGARSVVVVARNYFAPRPEEDRRGGRVARYAWGRDYHKVLRKPLIALARAVDALEPGTRSYCSIDTGPILERTWAQRAGVAAIGKNSLALRRDMGSWFFLATIITEVDLAPDAPASDLCGTCTLCLDACPTHAIVEPYVVDARLCISYQTIENRGTIPENLQPAHGDWIFGCDICQEVCPWNRFARTTDERDFHPRDGHATIDLAALQASTEDAFNEEFAGTPIRRPKHGGMLRNGRVVEENLQRGLREIRSASRTSEPNGGARQED